MNNKIKLAIIGTTLLLSALSFTRSYQFAQTTPQVPTAGQKFKNIKVLNDMPAEQLGETMNLMSASLGFNCAGCHVSGEKDFDKDDNQHKVTARKMITMTMELNKQFFNGRPEVSCNTCHNGHERPVSLPNLTPQPTSVVERPKQPAIKPTVDQILEKYAAALGGKDALSKVASRYIKANRIEPNGTTTEPEEVWQKSGKTRVETLYGKYLIAEVFDGTSAWKHGSDGNISLRGDEAAQIEREARLFANPDLKAVYAKLDYRFMDRIDGKDVYLVIATLADNSRERLYFDVATGFLVRRVASTPTVIGQFQFQVDYSDHKDFGGVKLPTITRFAVPNISWTRKILEVKNNEKIDDSRFTK